MSKRNSNHYHRHFDKKRRKHTLEVGMRGFLFTCNSKAKYCIREAYNILDDYYCRLFGDEKETIEVITESEEGETKNNEDEIEDELEKEVELLKKLKENPDNNEKIFQVAESGTNNCLFIKTTLPDPVELVSKVMEDVYVNRQQISRYIMRFMPVEVTCKAYVEDIKKACEKLFARHFVGEPTTYCIVYNKRYNNSLLRDEVIESVARLVQDRNILHKVDLNNGEKVIVINVIKAICCISVVCDYFKFKKYNLAELSKKNDDATTNSLNDTKVDSNDNTNDKGIDEMGEEPTDNCT